MSVLNLPTEEKLRDFAFALHFEAWERLHSIIEDFAMVYEGGSKEFPDEWGEYLQHSSRDLETIINLIAQASEIGMKSKLCKVSPYLLLLGQSEPLKSKRGDIDFSELRTLDAVDLPNAVANFSGADLPEEFISDFSTLRKMRNKSMHFGEGAETFSPETMITYLVRQYNSLWPDIPFLPEWLRASSKTRHAYFADGEHVSLHSNFYSTAPLMMSLLTKGQFKRLLKRDKNVRRYICWPCQYEAETDWADLSTDQLSLAYLSLDGSSITCLVCDATTPVIREECRAEDCAGNVISADHPDIDPGFCHTCGKMQDEISNEPLRINSMRDPATGSLIIDVLSDLGKSSGTSEEA